MKTLFTILLVSLFSFAKAQDEIYVHTATAENTGGHITTLDHAGLNGNPNASIIYKHVWNPNSGSAVYNNNIDGLWYNSSIGRWTIYNEDFSDMIIGAHFFVYIASDPTDVITHTVTLESYILFSSITAIDDPDFNGSNPGPYAIMCNYFNPQGVYNPHNYGFIYSTSVNKRAIFEEGNDSIPLGASYRILKSGNGVVDRFTHESTDLNTVNNQTIIDNINLNNNPNASFVYQHFYGVNGAPTEIEDDKVFSVFYNPTENKWAIYTEDQSAMPIGMAFDIIVANQIVDGIKDYSQDLGIRLFPNPVNDFTTITSEKPITMITIYDLQGKQIVKYNGGGEKTKQLNVSGFDSGVYFVKIEVGDSMQTIKLIKE